MLGSSLLLSCLAVLVMTPGNAGAQAQARQYKVNSIAPSFIRTPDIQFTGDTRRSPPNRQWLEIEVEFAAAPEWTDELTVRYFVAVDVDGKTELLVGDVTHVNIPGERRLYSVMYVAPRALQKLFGRNTPSANSIRNIHVELLRQGALQAQDNLNNQGSGEWWRTLEQKSGYLVNKSRTPFANLYYDRYEAIKPDRE